ncbi:MAG: hypothetical protein NVS3B26_12150 [Mycobacteriales bacterium]
MTRPRVLLVASAVLALAAPLAIGTSSAATGSAAAPSYRAYDLGITGGEPSIGYDRKAAAAIFGSGTKNKRLTWDSRNTISISDAKAPSSATSLDAITFTDQATNRTFVSQLVGACSLTSFSDDAGKTYTPTEGCGPGVLLDHQTVGGGPYAHAKPPTAGLTGYPDAVYYCAQNSYSGACARSDDGGMTFGPGVPTYNTPATGAPYGGACSAIHGHVRVSKQGVVYLPNKGCGGTPTANNLTNSEFFGGAPALSVSEDNGTTWSVRPVPGGHNPDESDPSVDADKAGTVFFGWEDGINPSETVYGTTSAAKIATSSDHGRTWSKPYDVSSALGIHNVQFPEVIAGDPGRAAFSFLGTKGIGDDQHNGFIGDWHLYVATTINDGKTWTTVDATPTSPVQRGCILLQGTSNKNVQDANLCTQRDLLDFNDITVDTAGRVLVAFSDGCRGTCKSGTLAKVRPEDFVLRQTGGPLLYANSAAAPTPVPAGAGGSASGGAGSGGSAPPSAAPGQRLPATGAGAALPVAALLLVGTALVLVRRRRGGTRS